MMKMSTVLWTILLCICAVFPVNGRKHKLTLANEERTMIDLTTFGFLPDSFLQISVKDFTTGMKAEQSDPGSLKNMFGFTFDKLKRSSSSSLENEGKTCALTLTEGDRSDANVIIFSIDFLSNELLIRRHGPEVQNLSLYSGQFEPFDVGAGNRKKRSLHEYSSDTYLLRSRQRRQAPNATPAPKLPVNPPESGAAGNDKQTPAPAVDQDEDQSVDVANVTVPPPVPTELITTSLPIQVSSHGKRKFDFFIRITDLTQQGLYKFSFRNCHDAKMPSPNINFTVFMIEKNGDNYLSAGHIPLPMLNFVLCVVFLGLACFWLYILRHSSEGVYKIHYMMLALIYIKSLALLFHAINYHFLAKEGHHEEAIAIIYYITYLMRGILLFVTIILIGAGWAFVKHILSDREKKVFLIIIPLQILANVAMIFTEETEEGESQFITWKEVFIVVDLLCCGAILLPVVWSIRHLQEASQTDGKAAISLTKLKLFRHFYILIVCYIYFTRIIVYLLNLVVPFQYQWLDDLFRELATLLFYIVTGYKFRPASDNPYLQVPQDSDDEVEMDEVITQSGALEGVTKVNVKVRSDPVDTSCGVSKRESSHDYD